MGNFHGNADQVREYFRPLVELVRQWETHRRLYAAAPNETDARKLTTFCIELTAWLDEHTWVETLPLVPEGKRVGS